MTQESKLDNIAKVLSLMPHQIGSLNGPWMQNGIILLLLPKIEAALSFSC